MDSTYIHRIAKLIPYPSKSKTLPSLAFVYHFEPPPEDQRGLGNLIATIEVMGRKQMATQVIDLIIKTMGDTYYNEDSGEIVEDRFEAALTATNKQLKLFATESKVDLSDKISAVLGILADEVLHVSLAGTAAAVLYRDGQESNITKDLADEATKDAKFFANVASGRLEEKDKLLVATPALFFQFKADKLQTMIEDNSPTSAVHKLSSLISGQENAERCAALILEITTPEIAANQALEDDGDEVLVGRPPSLKDSAQEVALPVAKKASQKTSEMAKKAKDWSQQTLVPTTKSKVKEGWNMLWTRVINRNPKLALIISLVVVALIIGLFVGLSNATSHTTANLTTFKEVVALTDSAEAKLELGDKASATELSHQATEKLATITDNKREQKALEDAIKKDPDLKSRNLTIVSVQNSLQSIDDKLVSLTRIKNPEIVANLTTIKNFHGSQLLYFNQKLYTVNLTDKSLYEVNPSDTSAKKIGTNASLDKTVASTVASTGDGIYFLTSEPDVIQYKPSQGGLTAAKLSAGDWATGIDIASYIGNLYILSPDTNQIWRHTPTAFGFSARSGWLNITSAGQIDSATSLAVNSSIFTIDKTDKVHLFANGTSQDLANTGFPDNLGSTKKILLSDDGKQLFVLTSDTKKIYTISLSDQGAQFNNQYQIENFNSIDSMAIDVKNSTIYALADDKIIKFTY